MLVQWKPGEPPACTEHGRLAVAPLPLLQGWMVILTHLQDVHGTDVGVLLARALELQDERH